MVTLHTPGTGHRVAGTWVWRGMCTRDVESMGLCFLNSTVHAINFNDNQLSDEGAEAVATLLLSMLRTLLKCIATACMEGGHRQSSISQLRLVPSPSPHGEWRHAQTPCPIEQPIASHFVSYLQRIRSKKFLPLLSADQPRGPGRGGGGLSSPRSNPNGSSSITMRLPCGSRLCLTSSSMGYMQYDDV